VTQPARYALVAYVRNSVGKFVENLRRELHPELSHLAAHVTVLPPRQLNGSESAAVEALTNICKHIEPFEASLGEMETFIPATPTVFIRVCHAAQRLRDLHDQLNVNGLATKEEWPYMPHMTIIKVPTEEQAQQAYLAARKRWDSFREPRTIQIERLTFVREERDLHWLDLATVPLGPRPSSSHSR
jgi:2'-5' RNA ligase